MVALLEIDHTFQKLRMWFQRFQSGKDLMNVTLLKTIWSEDSNWMSVSEEPSCLDRNKAYVHIPPKLDYAFILNPLVWWKQGLRK